MFQRPRWGATRPPAHGNYGNPGNFQPPQHRARYPGPRQPNGFSQQRPPNMQGGFNTRVKGSGMFCGPPHHEMEEFGVPIGFYPRGQGAAPRFNRPPPNGPGNMRPPFNGPQGPNFRPRFEMRPGVNSNHPQQRSHVHNTGQSQGINKQKKPKVDKRDLPENNKYFCEVCDRGYKEEEKYKEHINSHEKCKYEGCSYAAAPKLVQLHINLQHRTGLAKKIWSLESPEDIKKWREERRKNFPTAENVEKKKAIMAEKVARGEVIEEKYFGKMHQRGKGRFDRGRGRGRGKGRFQGERPNSDKREENKRSVKDVTEDDVSPAKKVRKDSAEGNQDNVSNQTTHIDSNKDPLGYFYKALSDFESDSDNERESSKKSKPPLTEDSSREITAAGALGSLISSYGDSEEETVDVKDNEESSTVAKDEEKSDKNLSKPDKSKRRNRNRGRKNNNNNNYDGNKPKQSRKDNKSLLEKLLAKEIRKERNQILQCVYHVVRNNFFDKPKLSETNGHDTSISDNSNGTSDTSYLDT